MIYAKYIRKALEKLESKQNRQMKEKTLKIEIVHCQLKVFTIFSHRTIIAKYRNLYRAIKFCFVFYVA